MKKEQIKEKVRGRRRVMFLAKVMSVIPQTTKKLMTTRGATVVAEFHLDIN